MPGILPSDLGISANPNLQIDPMAAGFRATGPGGILGYHATTAKFDAFKNPQVKDVHMLDRALGTHFAKDPEVSNSFVVQRVNGQDVGPRPGGRMIRAQLPSEDKFLEVNQPQYDYIQADPGKYAHLPINQKVKTDQGAIEQMIAKEAYQKDPAMLGRYLNEARAVPEEQAPDLAKRMVAGETVNLPVDGPQTFDRFINNFGGKPYNDADRQQMVDLARQSWQDQGYKGLKYINTSPMEMAGAKDPSSYVVFDPKDINPTFGQGILGQ